MCLRLREALSVGSIAFCDQFFSATGAAEAKKQLESELKAFAVITEAPRTAFGKTRRTFTGKTGGRNDDLCIALQLALAGSREFYSSERYAQFRQQPSAHQRNFMEAL